MTKMQTNIVSEILISLEAETDKEVMSQLFNNLFFRTKNPVFHLFLFSLIEQGLIHQTLKL